MSRADLRDERGGILLMGAVMIPVFLVLTALVVDVGNWFTHSRQLQNRADAGALAAGVELARQWPQCITNATAEAAVTAVAKRYAGDPSDGTAVNTEVANQSNFNVVVNSTNWDTGTDNSDASTVGNGPCDPHTSGDAITTQADATWVDVKVREVNTRSLSPFGIDLARNRTQARVELLEAAAGDQFVPLAIPEEEVAQARIRFINDCTGGVIRSSDLRPLQSAYQTSSGMELWGPAPSGNPSPVAPTTMSLATPGTVPVPGTSTCGNAQRDYTPIRVELRIAGREDIDISDTVPCSTLQTTTSADCYPSISQIRVYQPNGGLVGDRPQIRNVVLSPTGSASNPPPCVLDPYYARTNAPTSCTLDASVEMDWGGRPGPASAFSATIQVNGSPAANLTGPVPLGQWTAAQVRATTLGPNDAVVSWEWDYKGPGSWQGDNCNQGSGCNQSGSTRVHQVNLADDPGGNVDSPSDVVGAVKLTSGPSLTSSEVHSAEINTTVTPYVTIGLRGAYSPGDWAVLRLRSGQRNFSVICDPYWAQPSSVDAMAAFYYGCQPPYARNDTTQNTFWWNSSTSSCPPASGWFSYTGAPPNVTYPNTPWRCVQLDVGGNGYTVGDGVALATGNCQNPVIDPLGPGSHAKCQSHNYTCNNGITYTGGGPPYPSLDEPRVIKIFIVPWGAYKNVSSGNGQVVPVRRLAAFYVTAWKFNNGVDPCPGNDNNRLGGEQVGGYFIKPVGSGGGPANPTVNCNADDIDLCYVTLTR